MNGKAKDTLYIAGMILAWSAYYTMSKWAVDYTGSAFLAGFILRVAAFIFMTVHLCIKKKFVKLFKTGKIALMFVVIGIMAFLADAFANIGFSRGSVSTGTALLKTDILLANIVTIIVLKDKLYWVDWLGTAVMLIGVLFVLNIDFSHFKFNWYDMFFILSALSVTVNAFVIKSAQQKHNADPDTMAYFNNLTVMILFLVSSLFTKDIVLLTGISYDFKFFALVMLGALARSMIFIFYYYNLKRYPVWQVQLFLLLVPVVSCFIGIFAFGEKLVLAQYIGILAVLLGGALMLCRNKIIQNRLNL